MDITYLNKLRTLEIQDILSKYPSIFERKRVLEIGSGTGIQANEIKKKSPEIISLEVEETNYREHLPSQIIFYNGHDIPFPDDSFDVIYSSNVLEHIAHRDEFQQEIMRVLKSGGYAVHVMPTHWWKMRDLLQSIIVLPNEIAHVIYRFIRGKKNHNPLNFMEFILGKRHGEFGNTITETYHFSPWVWKRYFKKLGWTIVSAYPGGFFYSGRMWLAGSLSFNARKKLAPIFGSSVYIYVLQKNNTAR